VVTVLSTKTKGQITEAAIALSLLRKGLTVLTPYGENQPYDLVIEESPKIFKTVQCKTGRYKNGVVEFNLYSVVRNKETKRYKKVNYSQNIDYFGVYCAELEKCYLVPASSLPSGVGILRIEERLNNGGSPSKWAKEYEI
jgi:hypothetical protein